MTLLSSSSTIFFFFFNDTATTEIYTLSLHDALPICLAGLAVADDQLALPTADRHHRVDRLQAGLHGLRNRLAKYDTRRRSEEHTSELQSQSNLVCRLLLEKKNKKN